MDPPARVEFATAKMFLFQILIEAIGVKATLPSRLRTGSFSSDQFVTAGPRGFRDGPGPPLSFDLLDLSLWSSSKLLATFHFISVYVYASLCANHTLAENQCLC